MKLSGVAERWYTNPPLVPATLGLVGFGLAPLLAWALVKEQWIIFGGLLCIALIPVVVRWPVISTFGLYAFLAASLDAFPLLPGGASLAKPIGLLAGGALIAAGLVERRLGRPPRTALWWGLLVLWGVLSASWALDQELVFRKLPTVLSLFFLYVVATSFRPSRREVYWVCGLTVLGGVLAAVLAYTLGLNDQAAGEAARGRLVLQDMDTNPNTLGRLLLLPLALAITGFAGWRGLLQRVLTAGCACVIGLGILISMSRGAALTAMAMLAVLLYRMRARWLVVAAMLLLLAVSAVLPDSYYRRMGALLSGEDITGSGRTEIWMTGVEALNDFWTVGAGLNNFGAAYKRYVPGSGQAAHNMYLMVWVELGTVGFALMLTALASALLAVWKVREEGHRGTALGGVEAAYVGMLTAAIVGDQLWSKTIWLVLTLLTWCAYAERQSDDKVEEAWAARG
jgi:O-antigen ligase